MRKVNRYIGVLALFFLFTGCTQDQKTNENPAGGEGNKELSGKEVSTIEPIELMREYFPPDGSKVFFKGEGNEFAETIETPYQTFDNVFVIEEKAENPVNRKYFSPGVGEIKREAVMVTGDGDTVTSTLESLGE